MPIRSEATERFLKALGWLLGGILLGFALSKYSVRTAYQTGYSEAEQKYALHYKHQVRMFEKHRDRSCMAYWFDDKPSRVAEARRWMCQYTNKNERLR
jgi:hypothetical protein